MKRIALFSVLCCLALNGFAQDGGYFNHLSAGLKLGTAGAGLELAAPVGNYVQLRAGYAIMPPFSYTRSVDVPEHPGAHGSEKGANVPIDAKATLNISGAEFLVDIFTSSKGTFHFTLGLVDSPKDAIKVTNLTPMPSDYNTVGLDVDGYTVKAINNKYNGYIGVNSLRPYAGFGFGRAVGTDHRVNLTFDVGAVYWGGPALFAPGEPLIGDWEDVKITSASLNGKDEGLIELAEKFVFYPMLNFHVFVNLF